MKHCRHNNRAYRKMINNMIGILLGMFEPGRSKHTDKLANHGKPRLDKIYSYSTLDTYLRVCRAYLTWVHATYGCTQIAAARMYVDVYLRQRISSGLSAWTIRVDASALAKMYQCSYLDFAVALPIRHRCNSFKNTIDEYTLACWEAAYPMLAQFCRACGLRRCEILRLRTQDIYLDDRGRVIVHVRRGKGGKTRKVIALDDYPLTVRDQAIANGRDKVFASIPAGAPIHVLRKLYAQALYAKCARPIETLNRKQRYYCRGEMAGKVYDRAAMYDVSIMLGHARLGVVTTYLRQAIIPADPAKPVEPSKQG